MDAKGDQSQSSGTQGKSAAGISQSLAMPSASKRLLRINLAHTLPGRRIGRYLIQDRIGAGGMGNIFKVWDEGLKRSFALKVLPAAQALHKEAVARFQLELELLAKVQHPAVVSVVDAGTFDDAPFFVMELIEGQNLQQYAEREHVDADDAVRWMIQVARGVAHLHEREIVHRDIKPANILLRPDGLAVLTDFGLAQNISVDSDLTRSGLSAGTPAFMAPEQARGAAEDVGPATDIYQLGATLFSLLTGRPPHRGRTPHEIMLSIAESHGPDFSGVELDRQMRAVLSKAMAKSRNARYSSANEFADDLERWLLGEWVHARGRNPVLRAIYFARRYIASVAVASAGTAIVVSAIFAGGAPGSDSTPPEVYPAADRQQVNALASADVHSDAFLQWLELTRKDGLSDLSLIGVTVADQQDGGAFGWGDFSATMRFHHPEVPGHADPVICFVGSPLTSLLLDGEASDSAYSSGADEDGLDERARIGSKHRQTNGDEALYQEVLRQVRSGMSLEFQPDEQRLHVWRWGSLIADVDLSGELGRRPQETSIEIGVARRAGWLQIDVIPSHDRVPRTFKLMDRFASASSVELGDLRMGMLTRAPILRVGDMEYQQLNERGDIFEHFLWSGYAEDASVRISSKLAGSAQVRDEKVRTELQMKLGIALRAVPERQAEAKAALDAALASSEADVRFYAALALLQIQVERELARHLEEARQTGQGTGALVLPTPTVRRLMDNASEDVRQSEVVCELERIAALIAALPRERFMVGEKDLNESLRLEMVMRLLELAEERAYRSPHQALRVRALKISVLHDEAEQQQGIAAERLRRKHRTLLRESAGNASFATCERSFLELMLDLPQMSGEGQDSTWTGAADDARAVLESVSRSGALDVRAADLAERFAWLAFFDALGGPRYEVSNARRALEEQRRVAQRGRDDSGLSQEWLRMVEALLVDQGQESSTLRRAAIRRLLANERELTTLNQWERGWASVEAWRDFLELMDALNAGEERLAASALKRLREGHGLPRDHWMLEQAQALIRNE